MALTIEASVRVSWGLNNAQAADSPLKCPICGQFSRDSWISHSGSPDGPMTFGGGICSKHGDWMDGLINVGWL